MSGSTRSSTIASGGCTAPHRQRLARRWRPARPRSRRRAGWSSARAGSAARRRPPGCAPECGAHAGGCSTGSANANEAPWPGCDSAQTRPPLASAKPRAIASPSPAPPCRRRRLRTARRSARARRPGCPGRGRSTRKITSRRVLVPRTATGSPGGEWRRAFSIRLTSTRWAWVGSTRTGGRSARQLHLHAVAALARAPAIAWATSASGVHSSRTGAAAPAWRRDRSSRFETSRVSRSVSTRIVSSSARPVVVAELVGCGREPLDGHPDRGQRRPEVVADGAQDRRLGGVAAAQRLGLAPPARPAARGRPRPPAATPARAGTGGEPRGRVRPGRRGRSCRPGGRPTVSGSGDCPGRGRVRRAQLDPGASSRPARRRVSRRPPSPARLGDRLAAQERRRQVARSPPSRAPAARPRPPAPRARAACSAHRPPRSAGNTASANQLRESESVNECTGGRKNQLNASMLATDTTTE